MKRQNDNTKDNFYALFKKSGMLRPQLQGSFVEGTIVSTQKDILTVYTGLKTTNQFINKELQLNTDNKRGNLTVGARTHLFVHSIENIDGDTVYNPYYYNQKIKSVLAWDRVSNLKYVKGIVLNTVNGGFSVGVGGVVAFLPKSRAKLPENNKNDYIISLMNNYRVYKIIKVNDLRKNIVVSLMNTHTPLNTFSRRKN